MKALEKAISTAGSQTALAELIGVSPQAVNNWIRRRRVPADVCPSIERATGVLCEEIRPDVDWGYLRGTPGPAPERDTSRSKLSPLPESGQGANPGCPTDDPASTDAAAVSDVNQTAGAKKTAGRDVREVV